MGAPRRALAPNAAPANGSQMSANANATTNVNSGIPLRQLQTASALGGAPQRSVAPVKTALRPASAGNIVSSANNFASSNQNGNNGTWIKGGAVASKASAVASVSRIPTLARRPASAPSPPSPAKPAPKTAAQAKPQAKKAATVPKPFSFHARPARATGASGAQAGGAAAFAAGDFDDDGFKVDSNALSSILDGEGVSTAMMGRATAVIEMPRHSLSREQDMELQLKRQSLHNGPIRVPLTLAAELGGRASNAHGLTAWVPGRATTAASNAAAPGASTAKTPARTPGFSRPRTAPAGIAPAAFSPPPAAASQLTTPARIGHQLREELTAPSSAAAEKYSALLGLTPRHPVPAAAPGSARGTRAEVVPANLFAGPTPSKASPSKAAASVKGFGSSSPRLVAGWSPAKSGRTGPESPARLGGANQSAPSPPSSPQRHTLFPSAVPAAEPAVSRPIRAVSPPLPAAENTGPTEPVAVSAAPPSAGRPLRVSVRASMAPGAEDVRQLLLSERENETMREKISRLVGQALEACGDDDSLPLAEELLLICERFCEMEVEEFERDERLGAGAGPLVLTRPGGPAPRDQDPVSKILAIAAGSGQTTAGAEARQVSALTEVGAGKPQGIRPVATVGVSRDAGSVWNRSGELLITVRTPFRVL